MPVLQMVKKKKKKKKKANFQKWWQVIYIFVNLLSFEIGG